jgi:hypothetical protein
MLERGSSNEGLASDVIRAGTFVSRRDTLLKRLQRIEPFRRDEKAFERVVASDRYLRLCAVESALGEWLDRLEAGASQAPDSA